MKNKKLIILYSVIFFLVAFCLGFNAICSISIFDTNYTLSSDEGKREVAEIQLKLNDYQNKNMLFFNEDNVKNIYKDYNYIELVSLEKQYPNVIKIVAVEKSEVYCVAVAETNEFFMLDKDGLALSKKSTNTNRIDGGKNIVLNFDCDINAVGDKVLENNKKFDLVKNIIKYIETQTNGARSVAKQIDIGGPTEITQEGAYIRIFMQEGVSIKITNPTNLTSKKIKKAYQKYLSLFDSDKLYGEVVVTDNASDISDVVVTYVPRDQL